MSKTLQQNCQAELELALLNLGSSLRVAIKALEELNQSLWKTQIKLAKYKEINHS